MENAKNVRALIAGFPSVYQNYERSLVSAGLHVLYPSSRTLSHLYSLDFDLLLLPGGGDISPRLYDTSAPDSAPDDYVTDLFQFQLLQLALLKKKPVLGICKGMQLLNVYFGGSLYSHLPTADMHCSPGQDLMHRLSYVSHFPNHCRIFGSYKTAHLLKECLCQNVNSAHHQGLHTLGQNLITIQYSEDYLPETIAHKNLPILGLQWHPERLPSFNEHNFGKLLELLLQSAQL